MKQIFGCKRKTKFLNKKLGEVGVHSHITCVIKLQNGLKQGCAHTEFKILRSCRNRISHKNVTKDAGSTEYAISDICPIFP